MTQLNYVNGERREMIRAATIAPYNQPRTVQLRTLVGTAAASAELLNEALCKFIDLVYTEDADGSGYANIDLYTYRILIPVPWSRLDYISYGLRRTEQNVLRLLMLSTEKAQAEKCLFRFENRRWYLNVENYPTMASALTWIDRLNINSKAWKRCYKMSAQ
jgi:hypothetical protein